MNNKEWENFSIYFKDYKIKSEEKLLTKEILERPISYKIINPNEISRHAVILKDIDDDGNYILINSWGEKWGNKGIFRTRKECLKDSVFYAIYFNTSLLNKEEIESWEEFKENIKKSLKEMKSIRCPKCNKTALLIFIILFLFH